MPLHSSSIYGQLKECQTVPISQLCGYYSELPFYILHHALYAGIFFNCNCAYRMMTSNIKGTARVVNRVPTLWLGQAR